MARSEKLPGVADAGLKAHFLNERPTLLRFLLARLGDLQDAEDILQSIWTRLDRTASGPIADPAAHLFRMASAMAIDRRRAADRDWPARSAEGMAARSERLARVDAILAALPDRTAAIFRDYRYDGMPRGAIAEAHGIAIAAVERHLQKAYYALHDVDDRRDIR